MTSPKSEVVLKLERKWQKGFFVSIGLDSDYERLPSLKSSSVTSNIFNFNRKVIESTYDLACAYKLNSAFYEQEGVEGIKALIKTVKFIKSSFPEIPTILDAKRGDIGNTNLGYIKFAFEQVGADGITVSPFLGQEAVQPFLELKDKLIIILAKTSNPGSDEFQNLELKGKAGIRLHQYIAKNVCKKWNKNGNCGVVVGATYPKELKEVRDIIGDMPMLIPGIGSQGGDVVKTVKSAKDSRGWGMVINSGREIIFASKNENFSQYSRKALERLNTQIREALSMSS